MTDDLSAILNYLPLSPTLGTAGQPTRAQFPSIATAGYQLVINLALPNSDGALADEGAIATRLGMAYVHIPVVWERPERSQFELFCSVLAGAGDRPVFVHCAMNMRVSVFVYLDRVARLGVPEAIAHKDLHRIWKPNPIWSTFIQTMLTDSTPHPATPAPPPRNTPPNNLALTDPFTDHSLSSDLQQGSVTNHEALSQSVTQRN